MKTGARSSSVRPYTGSSSAVVNVEGKLLVKAPLSVVLGHTYLWVPPVNCFLIKIVLSRVPGPVY